jgi:hypothetical protein
MREHIRSAEHQAILKGNTVTRSLSDPHPWSIKAYVEDLRARLARATPEERSRWDAYAEQYVDSVPGLRELIEEGPTDAVEENQ